MSNSFGERFKITTYGESHGHSIGAIIDGCPSGITIDINLVQQELRRRRPGQSKITTQRKEEDRVQFTSGIFNGVTTGTPIHLQVLNQDQKSKDYTHLADKYRPNHADYTYQKKFGIRDYRGGGRSSARETVARVAAGAVAKLFLKKHKITCAAYVSAVGDIKLPYHYLHYDLNTIEDNIVRCPDMAYAQKMITLIEKVRKDQDTIGGIVTGVIKGLPVGLGEPVFNKLHAQLGYAMLSINAVKGFEYGDGFASVSQRGSEHNDIFINKDNKITTKTNHSGGIQGGISNGEDVFFNVAFKPVATIVKAQQTIDIHGNESTVKGRGRHDPCVVPRAVPIVEAMANLVIADMLLLNFRLDNKKN